MNVGDAPFASPTRPAASPEPLSPRATAFDAAADARLVAGWNAYVDTLRRFADPGTTSLPHPSEVAERLVDGSAPAASASSAFAPAAFEREASPPVRAAPPFEPMRFMPSSSRGSTQTPLREADGPRYRLRRDPVNAKIVNAHEASLRRGSYPPGLSRHVVENMRRAHSHFEAHGSYRAASTRIGVGLDRGERLINGQRLLVAACRRLGLPLPLRSPPAVVESSSPPPPSSRTPRPPRRG